ncbi:DUF1559 domain-containing protein [Planctomycetes bacterium K23_9]|uniref:DUF1559 domain-containing protein n=1 Tax=Stieleria marina TaxID=1930275 RepID=A0A517NXL4_9BACT|nr:hypothetical protein K239x_38730 [Planctomycetes bacterium K23_9]
MKRALHLLTFVLLTFVSFVATAMFAPSVLSQEKPVVVRPNTTLLNDVDTTEIMRATAKRYVDHSTIAVAEINLERIAAANLTKAFELFPKIQLGKSNVVDATALMQAAIKQIRSASAKRLYVITSLSSFQEGGPLIVIPCQNPAAVDGVVQNLAKDSDQANWLRTMVSEDALLLGPQLTLDRSKAVKPVERIVLMSRISKRDSFDHSLSIHLPEETRAELAALWPDVAPASWPLKFSPRQVMQDAEHASVSWSLMEMPRMSAQVLGSDESAAKRLETLIKEAVELRPELKQSVSVSVDKRRVNLNVSSEQFPKLLSQVVSPVVAKNDRMSRMSDVKQVLLAFHNFHSAYKYIPARCWTDKASKPLLSWRVAVLPFMNQQAIWQEMDRTQAWDSDQNRPFSETVIPAYSGIRPDPKQPHSTRLRAPVFPGSAWHGEGEPKRFRDVIDGLSNTIAVIVAPPEAATPWASPEPWIISTDDPMKDVFGDQDEVIVARFDGSIQVIKKTDMTNKKLAAMLTIAGKEVIKD